MLRDMLLIVIPLIILLCDVEHPRLGPIRLVNRIIIFELVLGDGLTIRIDNAV